MIVGKGWQPFASFQCHTDYRQTAPREVRMPRLLLLLASAALSRGAITPNAPECWGTEDRYRSFSGSMTTNGGEVVEQIGRRGSERVLQKKYGELRVCMVTQGRSEEHTSELQ